MTPLALLSTTLTLGSLLQLSGTTFTAMDHAGRCLRGRAGAHCRFSFNKCKWRSEEWQYTGLRFITGRAQLATSRFQEGSLRSPLICSTKRRTHCLKFAYKFWFQPRPPVKLTVLLEIEGDKGKNVKTVPIWQLADSKNGYFKGQVPIQTDAAFRIVFKAENPAHYKPSSKSTVSLTKILYSESGCSIRPTGAVTNNTSYQTTTQAGRTKTAAMSSTVPTTTTPLPTTKSSSVQTKPTATATTLSSSSAETTTPSSSSPNPETDGPDDKKKIIIIVCLVIVVVVTVTALLVVMVVVCVRRKKKTNSQCPVRCKDGAEMLSVASTGKKQHGVGTPPQCKDTDSHLYQDIPAFYDRPGSRRSPPNHYSSLQAVCK